MAREEKPRVADPGGTWYTPMTTGLIIPWYTPMATGQTTNWYTPMYPYEARPAERHPPEARAPEASAKTGVLSRRFGPSEPIPSGASAVEVSRASRSFVRYCRAHDKHVNIVSVPPPATPLPFCEESCTKDGMCDGRPCKWGVAYAIGSAVAAEMRKTDPWHEWRAGLMRTTPPFFVDYTETAWDPCVIAWGPAGKANRETISMLDRDVVCSLDLSMVNQLRQFCLSMTVEAEDLISWGLGVHGYDDDPRALCEIPEVLRYVAHVESRIPDLSAWISPRDLPWYAASVFHALHPAEDGDGRAIPIAWYQEWVEGVVSAAQSALKQAGAEQLAGRIGASIFHKAGWALHEGWGAWFKGPKYQAAFALEMWKERKPYTSLVNLQHNIALIKHIRAEAELGGRRTVGSDGAKVGRATTGGQQMKMMCLDCGYTLDVLDANTSPDRCDRCRSARVQLLPTDTQVVKITDAGATGVSVSRRVAGSIPASAPGTALLSCYSCGLYEDYAAPTPTSLRGSPCPSCGSRLTRIIPFHDVERDRRAEAIGQEGERLFALQDYRKAVEKFREALTLAPENPNLLLDIGNALGMLGSETSDRRLFDESIEYLTKALRLFPDFERAARNLKITRAKLAESQDRFGTGKKWWEFWR